MGTSAQKLQKIRDSKEAIRLAIAAKGVTIPANTKLADYDDKIALIDEWVAPSDWIQLEEPTDNEILLLASDINPYYAFVVTVVGGYTVNWGDGTVDNWASNATASHTYTVGAGQVCNRGYTTFKIRIYAQTPANPITLFKISNALNYSDMFNSLLWVKFNTTGLTNLVNAFNIGGARKSSCAYLECVELPESLTQCSDYTSFLNSAICLKKVKMPLYYYSAGNMTFLNAFYNCSSLENLDYRAEILNISSFQGAHWVMSKLKKITFPKVVNGLSNISSFVRGTLITELNLFDINTDIGVFSNSIQENAFLEKLTFPNSWNNRIKGGYYPLQRNGRLRTITLPENIVASGNSMEGVFQGNFMLREVTLPNGFSGATMLHRSFQEMNSLETVNNFPIMNNVSDYSYAFYLCYKLKNIDNLDQLGNTTSVMNLEFTYVGCYSLNPAGGLRIRNKIGYRFILAGVDVNNKAALQALLFTNPAAVSTWAGSSPQIDISYCSMEAAALNALFTSIIATSASFSGKTIRITGNPGAATCDTTIITNAGGTVNKTT